MSFTIAVAGKGGTGKSTFAALVIETLKRRKSGSILAVDADPNATLGILLGSNAEITVSDIVEETKGLRNLPDGMSKPAHLEYKLQQAVVEAKGFDLLVMGRPEGPECYCMANNILRGYINEIANNYKYVVIDNEAGMEHLSRKTTQDIDALMMVSNPTRIGLLTARRIRELIDRMTFLNIKSKYLVLNKVSPHSNPLPLGERIGEGVVDQEIKDIGIPLIGTLPLAPEITQLELAGKSLASLADDSGILKACEIIISKVMKA